MALFFLPLSLQYKFFLLKKHTETRENHAKREKTGKCVLSKQDILCFKVSGEALFNSGDSIS